MQDFISFFQREEMDIAILLPGLASQIEASAQWAGDSVWEKATALKGKYHLPGNACPKRSLSLMRHFNNQALEGFSSFAIISAPISAFTDS